MDLGATWLSILVPGLHSFQHCLDDPFNSPHVRVSWMFRFGAAMRCQHEDIRVHKQTAISAGVLWMFPGLGLKLYYLQRCLMVEW
ncbi:hypothetical protein BGZ60DRAFT_409748 [Tricladium varicosporioides]|nr:hypothetical protein BGZ60DRAFT_409748 [Hymenoscyphus varicosporioides]